MASELPADGPGPRNAQTCGLRRRRSPNVPGWTVSKCQPSELQVCGNIILPLCNVSSQRRLLSRTAPLLSFRPQPRNWFSQFPEEKLDGESGLGKWSSLFFFFRLAGEFRGVWNANFCFTKMFFWCKYPSNSPMQIWKNNFKQRRVLPRRPSLLKRHVLNTSTYSILANYHNPPSVRLVHFFSPATLVCLFLSAQEIRQADYPASKHETPSKTARIMSLPPFLSLPSAGTMAEHDKGTSWSRGTGCV